MGENSQGACRAFDEPLNGKRYHNFLVQIFKHFPGRIILAVFSETT